LKKNGCPMN